MAHRLPPELCTRFLPSPIRVAACDTDRAPCDLLMHGHAMFH